MMTIGLNFNHFDISYRELVTKAVEKMEEVMSHSSFLLILKDEINKSNGLEGELSEWGDASDDEIYNQLFPVTLYLNTYYSPFKVIGYGLPGTSEIYLNTKYLNSYKVNDPLHLMYVGSNLLHEHSHDCGFEHDYKATKERPNSLSYILNRVYERTYRVVYNLPEPQPVIFIPWWRKVWTKLKLG